ncbi:hypothetical protein ACFLZA_02700 [Candidatus Neomarinimicrobiota bacterium]
MKLLLLTLFIILNLCFAQSIEADSLDTPRKTLGFDKVQHVAFGCLWTLSSQYILENKSGFGEDKALYYAVGSAVSLGLAKESYDSQTRKKSFDWGDMLANGIGIVVAILIIAH